MSPIPEAEPLSEKTTASRSPALKKWMLGLIAVESLCRLAVFVASTSTFVNGSTTDTSKRSVMP